MRTIATFRMTHESGGTAAQVTQRLGLTVTHTREAVSPNRAHSAWILSSAPEPQDDVRLSEMLERLLNQLEPVTELLWSLEREGYCANWLCLLDGQDGEAATELTRETLRRSLALPGDLWLDTYPAGQDQAAGQ